MHAMFVGQYTAGDQGRGHRILSHTDTSSAKILRPADRTVGANVPGRMSEASGRKNGQPDIRAFTRFAQPHEVAERQFADGIGAPDEGIREHRLKGRTFKVAIMPVDDDPTVEQCLSAVGTTNRDRERLSQWKRTFRVRRPGTAAWPKSSNTSELTEALQRLVSERQR